MNSPVSQRRFLRVSCRSVSFPLLLLLFLIGSPGFAAGGSEAFHATFSDASTIRLDFQAPPARTEVVNAGGASYLKVDLGDCGTGSLKGAPRLPVPRCLITLPLSATWDVTVTDVRTRDLPLELPVLPLQPLRRLDQPEPPFTMDPSEYARSGFEDLPWASLTEVGVIRGERLALLSLNAVRYDPEGRLLRLLEGATIQVSLSGGDAERTAASRRRYRSPVYESALNRLVVNRRASLPTDERFLPGASVGLVVVSAPPFSDDPMLQEFLAWKERKGLVVTHVSTTEIGGTKEEIRDYLVNAYFTWPIPPSLLLLVGDTPAIPHWVGYEPEYPATDLYYGTLSGNGCIPDITMGRISVASVEDLHNYLAKALSYEQAGWSGNDGWESHLAFVAGCTGFPGLEPQCDYCIEHYTEPAGQTADKLYCWTYDANSQDVIDAVNEGRSQVTYSGHGDDWCWGEPGFSRVYANTLLRNTVYPFIQAYTCETGQYEGYECLGETFIRAEHGAIGYYGSSTYSYGALDPTLQICFYEGMYDDQFFGGYNQTWLGGMLLYARMAFYCAAGDLFGCMYAEQYNLLGDPSIDLWMHQAQVSEVAAPEVVPTGTSAIEVEIPGLVHGMVTARKRDGGDSLFVTCWTDSAGRAAVSLGQPLGRGILELAVTAHDRVPWLRDVPVIDPNGPLLLSGLAHVVDGGGDGDESLDAGEIAGLDLALTNAGFAPAEDVVGVLTCPDPRVVLSNDRQSFGTIAPGDSAANQTRFRVRLDGSVPDQQAIPLTLSVFSAVERFTCAFSFSAQAPALRIWGDQVDDAEGDGNGVADPGETVSLSLWVENLGHSDCGALRGILRSADVNLQILDQEGECSPIELGQRSVFGSFRLLIAASCPTPATLRCDLLVRSENGFAASLPVELTVGSWVDDFETDRGWIAGAPGDDAEDGVWERVAPLGTRIGDQWVQTAADHTPTPGKLCFVTGNGRSSGNLHPNEKDVDGGRTTLLTPPLRLGDAVSAVVSYWRWFTNDLGENPGQDFWDVEVTADGVTWVPLEHTNQGAAAWVFATFALEDHISLTDDVRIRFVVRDDAPDGLVEAAVDDFTLTAVRRLPGGRWAAVGGEAVSGAGSLLVLPSPLRPPGPIMWRMPAAGPVQLSLHDVSGRLMRTLADERKEAGEHQVIFDGRDQAGRALASGIYYLRLKSEGGAESRRVLVMR